MRVLLTTDNLGGVWTFSISLAKGLKRHRIDVFLAITGRPLTTAQREELRGIPYYFAAFKQEWMDDPWEDTERAGRWLMQIADQVKPHVIHLNSYTWGNLDWKQPVVMTIHSCVLSWWRAVKKKDAPRDWDRYRELVSAGIRAAGILTAPSKAMLDAAEELYGPFARSRVIYNGRENDIFRSSRKEKFIFSMGRLWDEAKNISLLISAAPMIDYPVVIAGETTDNDLQTPENVEFTGFINPHQVAGWLSKAAIYALPVRYEPFGYTFLEAAYSGCALIGGDIRSLREIWGESMVYTDPDNPSKLALTVNKLMERNDERQKYAVAAVNKAKQYTLDRMLTQYKDLYEETNRLYTYRIGEHHKPNYK